MTEPVYHGTRAAFRAGGYLLPEAATEHREVINPLGDEREWVYFTPDLDLATVCALTAPGKGRPRVLVVQPYGKVERDIALMGGEEVEAYRCEWAKVLRVLPLPPQRP